MEELEFHFVHGFLGSPSDWTSLREQLGCSRAICYDLIHDMNQIPSLSPSYFKAWAELKNKNLKTTSKKVLVAYSLGGRLSLHLDLNHFDKVILIGAHPGLEKDHEARKKADLEWAEKLTMMPFKDWLRLWDSQPIFQFDHHRPNREISPQLIPVLQRQLIHWSLAVQTLQDEVFKKHCDKIYWCCGEKDEKFLTLTSRMQTLLGSKDHVFKVPDSGHGVIFDNPLKMAQEIQRILKIA